MRGEILGCTEGFLMCLCEFRDACARPVHFGITRIDIDFAAMQIGELGLISRWHSKFFCDQRIRKNQIRFFHSCWNILPTLQAKCILLCARQKNKAKSGAPSGHVSGVPLCVFFFFF